MSQNQSANTDTADASPAETPAEPAPARTSVFAPTRRMLSVALALSSLAFLAVPASLVLRDWLLYAYTIGRSDVLLLAACTLAGVVVAAPVAAVWQKTARRGPLVTIGLTLAGAVTLTVGVLSLTQLTSAAVSDMTDLMLATVTALTLLLLFTGVTALNWAIPAAGWSARRASWKPLVALPLLAGLIVAAVGLSAPILHPLPDATLRPVTNLLNTATRDLATGDHAVTITQTGVRSDGSPVSLSEETARFNVATRTLKSTVRPLSQQSDPASQPSPAPQPQVTEIVGGVDKASGLDNSRYRQYLDQVRLDAATVTTWSTVGQDTVDEAATTHYHGTVDRSRYAQADYAQRLEQTPNASYCFKLNAWLNEQGLTESDVQVDVWLDGHGHLRALERADHFTAHTTMKTHYAFTS